MNKSLEALWTVAFRTPQGRQGNGIVVIDTRRIYGGDSTFYYLGHVESKNNQIEATVQVNHYGEGPRLFPGAGDKYEIKMSGTRHNENIILLNGQLTGQPQYYLNLVLTRREALP